MQGLPRTVTPLEEPRTAADPLAGPVLAEPSVLAGVNAVLIRWRLVLLTPLLIAGLAVAAGMLVPVRFMGNAAVIPVAGTSGQLNAMAGVASQLGIELPTAGRPFESPSLYAELLGSRGVLAHVVEQRYRWPENGSIADGDLRQYYAARPAMGRQRTAVERLRRSIAARANRETGVVSFRVTAPDSLVAEQLAGAFIGALNSFNLGIRQSVAAEEERFTADRLQHAQNELRQAENELRTFLRQNRQYTNSPELTLEAERLRRQIAMRQEVFLSLTQAHERARIEKFRDLAVISVIDPPAAEPQSRRLLLRGLVGGFTGLLIGTILALSLGALDRARARGDRDYAEFDNLVRRIVPARRRSAARSQGGRGQTA